MALRVGVDEYERTHGRRPRGFGTWQFALGRGGSWTSFQHVGRYGEAAEKALREARGLGCDAVEVQP